MDTKLIPAITLCKQRASRIYLSDKIQKVLRSLDLRKTGGFIQPVGIKEKADDIPAMLSNNEFVIYS